MHIFRFLNFEPSSLLQADSGTPEFLDPNLPRHMYEASHCVFQFRFWTQADSGIPKFLDPNLPHCTPLLMLFKSQDTRDVRARDTGTIWFLQDSLLSIIIQIGTAPTSIC